MWADLHAPYLHDGWNVPEDHSSLCTTTEYRVDSQPYLTLVLTNGPVASLKMSSSHSHFTCLVKGVDTPSERDVRSNCSREGRGRKPLSFPSGVPALQQLLILLACTSPLPHTYTPWRSFSRAGCHFESRFSSPGRQVFS